MGGRREHSFTTLANAQERVRANLQWGTSEQRDNHTEQTRHTIGAPLPHPAKRRGVLFLSRQFLSQREPYHTYIWQRTHHNEFLAKFPYFLPLGVMWLRGDVPVKQFQTGIPHHLNGATGSEKRVTVGVVHDTGGRVTRLATTTCHTTIRRKLLPRNIRAVPTIRVPGSATGNSCAAAFYLTTSGTVHGGPHRITGVLARRVSLDSACFADIRVTNPNFLGFHLNSG